MFSEDKTTVSLTDTKIDENIADAAARPGVFFYHPDTVNIENEAFYAKGWKGYIESGANCIANLVVKYVNSPLIWKHGHRQQVNFKFADWIGLDIDGDREGCLTIEQALERFKDYIHVVGTTRSHQIPKKTRPPCDRFRVFLKLKDRCRSLDDYKHTLAQLGEEVKADAQAFDGARKFLPCKSIVNVNYTGKLVEIQKAPPEKTSEHLGKKYLEAKVRLDERYKGTRYIPPFVQDWLDYGCPDGVRGKVCFKIGIHLGRSGFSENEIVTLIMGSPVPIDKTCKIEKQVRDHVRSGMRRS